MNLSRVALAGFVAWVAFCVIGFIANAVLMRELYEAHLAFMRPEAESNARLPLAFAVSLVAFFAFAYAYAKGYEGGAGVQEGLRFGVLVAVLLIGFGVIWEFMVYPLSRTFLLVRVVDVIVEFAIYGAIVGAIYKPRPAAALRAAAI
jgi:ABC-type multidrug transport system permease subunit